MLVEYLSALLSLDLAVQLADRQVANVLRATARRIMSRLKYDVVYEAMARLSTDMNSPEDRLAHYWKLIDNNGGIQNVLRIESESKLSVFA